MDTLKKLNLTSKLKNQRYTTEIIDRFRKNLLEKDLMKMKFTVFQRIVVVIGCSIHCHRYFFDMKQYR